MAAKQKQYVSQADNLQEWIGTSAERATLDTTGLTPFSMFYETDTKLVQIWNGSAWNEM